jgi:predicted TIM-barrel fold metal-dependent hydrolase
VEADEALARYAFAEMGDDYFVFSTDFPHQDCRYPNAARTLIEQPFDESATRKILWDNCARLYDF